MNTEIITNDVISTLTHLGFSATRTFASEWEVTLGDVTATIRRPAAFIELVNAFGGKIAALEYKYVALAIHTPGFLAYVNRAWHNRYEEWFTGPESAVGPCPSNYEILDALVEYDIDCDFEGHIIDRAVFDALDSYRDDCDSTACECQYICDCDAERTQELA